MGSTPVTDAGVKHLKGLKKLRRLTLNRTAITDAGLGHLSGLTNLEVLEVGGTRITNAGLPHLKGFANLAYLDIRSTEVTDAGLEHLWGLKKLQVAYLPHHISDQAWKRFQEAVPTVTGSSFPKVPGDYLTNPGEEEGVIGEARDSARTSAARRVSGFSGVDPSSSNSRRPDMTTRLVAKGIYALVGAAFLAAGAATLLVNTGLLPGSVRNVVVRFSQDNPVMLHILQEFGSVLVLLGLLTFWFIRHYEQSLFFHWAMTAYWAIMALIHWFHVASPEVSVVGGLINTIPFAMFLAIGLLRLANEGPSPLCSIRRRQETARVA